MITLVAGSACQRLPSTRAHAVIRVAGRQGFAVPHQLLRAALPVLRIALAASDFETRVASSQAALSIVFGGLHDRLSETDRATRQALVGGLTSHLTHNVPMQERLWEHHARFLLDAHASVPFAIVIDDLAQLDASSFALLRQLFREDPARAPDVIVGNTGAAARVAMDDRGIAWALDATDLQHRVAALRRITSAVEPAAAAIAASPCQCAIARDAWDLAPEQALAQLLARPVDTLTASEVVSIAPLVQALAESFAFDSALRLALAALDANLPLPSADRAIVCGVAAIAAHNRQFFSRGNHRLACFLRDMYGEALAHELDAERRISLHYRLAVTHARRLGDLARARQAIDAGLAELAHAGLPAPAHQLQHAWLDNIDAFVRVRHRDPEAAFACCERAFASLTSVATVDPARVAELELSKLVITENALTLASMTRDERRRNLWLARGRDGSAGWPSLEIVNLLDHQRSHLERLDIVAARAACLAALELARGAVNPELEYFVLICASDLSFRMADHDAAAAHGDEARGLVAEIGDLLDTRLALELRAAELAELRDRPEVAEQTLQALVADAPAALGLRVEVEGRLATLCARRGDRDRALALVAGCIDRAADSGALDLLLRASCDAGEVARVLEMPDDANDAYDNCFELLDSEGSVSTSARELIRLKAVLGQLALDTAPPAQLATCVQRLPSLLVQERDAWPLARALVGAPRVDQLVAPADHAAMRTIRDAIARCAAPLAVHPTVALDRG